MMTMRQFITRGRREHLKTEPEHGMGRGGRSRSWMRDHLNKWRVRLAGVTSKGHGYLFAHPSKKVCKDWIKNRLKIAPHTKLRLIPPNY